MYKGLILHIPHSSSFIPNDTMLLNNEQLNLVHKQTDVNTDILFKTIGEFNNIKPIIFNYNRYYCDVERFWDDENENMSKIGQGVYYVKDLKGNNINRLDLKDDIKHIYDEHHTSLLNIANDTINEFGDTLIIDCHSFNDDFIDDVNLPDICIGFNENIPVVEIIKKHFINNGYSVELNFPYKGSIYPNGNVNTNKGNLDTIMIEVNKRFYLNNDVNTNKFNVDVNNLYRQLLM